MSSPRRTSVATIRRFASSKVDWIRRQQQRVHAQERPIPSEYRDGEIHAVWGQACELRVVERSAAPVVRIEENTLVLQVRPGADAVARQAVLHSWYRQLLREEAEPLIEQWERRLGVTVNRLFVRRMRTLWGSCSPRKQTIRLNAELARRPRECLEYIVVHEMVHLLEPSHNERFYALLESEMPDWRDPYYGYSLLARAVFGV